MAGLPAIYTFERAYILEIEPVQEIQWMEAVPRHLEQWINNLSRMFVAVQNTDIVGHCFWEPEDEQALLASLFVAPDWRRCLSLQIGVGVVSGRSCCIVLKKRLAHMVFLVWL